jgi:hypothetical protein
MSPDLRPTALPMARDVVVSSAILEPSEIGNVVGTRWWTAGDLEADGTAVVPDLPELMRSAGGQVLERRSSS